MAVTYVVCGWMRRIAARSIHAHIGRTGATTRNASTPTRWWSATPRLNPPPPVPLAAHPPPPSHSTRPMPIRTPGPATRASGRAPRCHLKKSDANQLRQQLKCGSRRTFPLGTCFRSPLSRYLKRQSSRTKGSCYEGRQRRRSCYQTSAQPQLLPALPRAPLLASRRVPLHSQPFRRRLPAYGRSKYRCKPGVGCRQRQSAWRRRPPSAPLSSLLSDGFECRPIPTHVTRRG